MQERMPRSPLNQEVQGENNIVEWNSPVISILILHTSKELKHWKKSHLKSGP